MVFAVGRYIVGPIGQCPNVDWDLDLGDDFQLLTLSDSLEGQIANFIRSELDDPAVREFMGIEHKSQTKFEFYYNEGYWNEGHYAMGDFSISSFYDDREDGTVYFNRLKVYFRINDPERYQSEEINIRADVADIDLYENRWGHCRIERVTVKDPEGPCVGHTCVLMPIFLGNPLRLYAVEFEPYPAHLFMQCFLQEQAAGHYEMELHVRFAVSDPAIDPDAPTQNDLNAIILLSWDDTEPDAETWYRFNNEMLPRWREVEFLKKLANQHSKLHIATQPVPGIPTYSATFWSPRLRERIEAKLPDCAHLLRPHLEI